MDGTGRPPGMPDQRGATNAPASLVDHSVAVESGGAPTQPKRKLASFARNTMVVAGGTAVSQAILVATMPFVTRLYSPAEFGAWSVFVSILAVFTAMGTWRYELAIMLPERDEDAASVFALSGLVSLAMSALLLVLVILGRAWLVRALGAQSIAGWLWCLPFMLFLTGMYQAGTYWASRTSGFKTLGVARVGLSTGTVATQLGAGLLAGGGSGWLIAGSVAGQVVGTGALLARLLRHGSHLIRSSSWASMKENAARYRNFPLFNMPYVLIGVFRERMMIFLLSGFASARIVGFYGMANRISMLPVALIATSMSTVFYQKAAAARESQDLGRFVLRVLTRLVVLGTPLLVLFLFDAPWLFSAVLGSRWAECARYAQFLAVSAFFLLLTTWLDRILDVLGRQRLALILEITFSALSLSAFAIGLLVLRDPILAIAAYAIAVSAYYVVWLVVAFRVASFPGAGLARLGLVFVSVLAVAVAVHWISTALLGTLAGATAYALLAGAFLTGSYRWLRRREGA